MAQTHNRAKFVRALVIINLAVGWAAITFLPKVTASFTYQSPLGRTIKGFLYRIDWSMVFAIVGISALLSVALWLTLSSYKKLPANETAQNPDEEEG